jgi:hypothetical protein
VSSRRRSLLGLVASAAATACLGGAADAFVDPTCGGGVLVASAAGYSVAGTCNPIDPAVTPPVNGGGATSPTGAAIPGGTSTTVDPSGAGSAGPAPIEVDPAPVTLDAKGRVPVTVACPATAAAGCAGVITLSMPDLARPKQVVAARHGPSRPRVVGRSKPFQLAAGQQVVVPVSLERRGVRIFRRHGHRKLEVSVAVTTASGTTTVKSTITVKARRRPPTRRR